MLIYSTVKNVKQQDNVKIVLLKNKMKQNIPY